MFLKKFDNRKSIFNMELKKRYKLAHIICCGGMLLAATIFCGTAMAQVKVGGNVFGGGNLAAVSGDTKVTIDQSGALIGTKSGQTLTPNTGDVYGGGALADVGTSSANTTTVDILQGTVYGSVYGGGLGDDDRAAAVNGVVTVNIGAAAVSPATDPSGEATINGAVFGCNNANGTPKDDVFVNIYKTARISGTNMVSDNGFALSQVFGGGNQAHYEPSAASKKTTVHIYTCDNTIEYVYGGGNAADVGNSTINSATEVIIDGGRIKWVFGGGNGYSSTNNHSDPDAPNYNPGANINGNTKVTFHAGDITYIFGGSNQYGNVTGNKTVEVLADGTCQTKRIAELYGGSNEAPTTGDVSLTMSCNANTCQIKRVYGGSRKADIKKDVGGTGGNVTLTIEGGTYNSVFGGNNINGVIEGNVTLNLYGGTIDTAFGGNNESGSIYGIIQVNMLDAGNSTCPLHVNTVYGGGNLASYSPTYTPVSGTDRLAPEVNIKHGTVNNAVYGGGLGATAIVNANPKVTIGDNVAAHYAILGSTLNGTSTQGVGNVYGGGDQAAVNGSTWVIYNDENASSRVNRLFGGGNEAGVTDDNGADGNATIDMTNGKVLAGIYGGCNTSGNIAGDIEVNVTGGTVGAADSRANIHGGGYGNSTTTSGDVTVNFGEKSGSHSDNPVLYGDIYGGSGFGNVNNSSSNTTTVNVLNGNITGDVYGGGLGSTSPSYPAQVKGQVFVNIGIDDNGTVYGQAKFNTYTVSSVTKGGMIFGCNNENGSPKDDVVVNIYQTAHGINPAGNLYPTAPSGGWTVAALKTNRELPQGYAIAAVYGGGNVASYIPAAGKNTTVHVHGCANTIEDVYGGGNAADVGSTGQNAVTTNTNVIIDGGRIHRVFGGGNGEVNAANIYGTATTTVNAGLIDQIFGAGNKNGSITSTSLVLDKQGSCDEVFGEVFGGGNEAPFSGTLATTINCGVGTVGDIYGGSNLADIGASTDPNPSSVTLTINGGTYNNVYGGSKGVTPPQNATQQQLADASADIYGSVTLNLYGGTMEKAFGGSNINGNIDGKITVNVLDYETPTCTLKVNNIYGAGNVTPYTPTSLSSNEKSPVVNVMHIKSGNSITGNVYGGALGATATVTSDPQVKIGYDNTMSIPNNHPKYSNTADLYASVSGNVYGGGDEAPVVGSTSVTIQHANSSVANLYGGGNLANVSGSTTVSVTDGTVTQDVYGGGALAHVNINESTNPASATNGALTSVSISGGTVRMLFGGGMGNSTTEALVYGNTEVTVSDGTINGNKINSTGDDVKGGVFGGCNVKGTVLGSAMVNINGTVGSTTNNVNVYGGGLGENTNVQGSVAVTVSASVNGDVYGGSAKGLVNYTYNSSTNPSSGNNITTSVTLGNTGAVSGDIYGGGHGIDNAVANVGRAVAVEVNGGSVTNVFGCNNLNGTPQGPVAVTVNSTQASTISGSSKVYAINGVYGGGNKAHYVPANLSADSSTVTINGCASSIKDVYGGGNAAAVPNTNVIVNGGDIDRVFAGGNGESGTPAHIGWKSTVSEPNSDSYGTGNVSVTIQGGTINQLFGGSNSSGVVRGKTYMSVNPTGTCELNLDEVFCGSNMANISGDVVSVITCNNFTIGTLYGGCNQANVVANNSQPGNVTLTVNGGTYNNIYGGSKGTVSTGANIAGDVTLNIYGGTVLQAVYGGSNINGSIGGNITVTVEDKGGECPLNLESANVYGGGNLAVYTAPTASGARDYNPMVRINHATVKNVYGGGKGDANDNTQTKGSVKGTPKVFIGVSNDKRATVLENVFGGGDAAKIEGNTVVDINHKSIVRGSIFGGGNAADIAKVNSSGGDTEVLIKDQSKVYGNVYGGGNMGKVAGNTKVIVNGVAQ